MKEPCDWARGPLQFGMEGVSRSIHPTPGAGACTWSIEGHKDARVKWHRELYTAGPGPLQQKAQKRMQSKWKVLLGAFPVIRGKIQRGESAREGEESEAGGERLRDREDGWREGWWRFTSVIAMWTIHTGENRFASPPLARRNKERADDTVPPWSETDAWLWLHSVPLPL